MLSRIFELGKTFKYEGWLSGGQTPFTSLEFVVCSCVVYLGIVWSFSPNASTKTKESSVLKFLLGLHNVILCLASVVMFAGTMNFVLSEIRNNVPFLEMFCDSKKTYARSPLYFWMYIFYLSKMYEWIDTFFLLAKGSKLSFLHVYHHFLTFVVAYVGLEVETTYAFVALLVNCFIHSIMYFYYGCYCWFGVKLGFAKYLTILQMSQFLLNFVAIGYWTVLSWQTPGGCSGGDVGRILCSVAMVTYFILFYQMVYVTKYNNNNTTKTQKKNVDNVGERETNQATRNEQKKKQ